MFGCHRRAVQSLFAALVHLGSAVGSPEGMRTLPDLPTFAELGCPQFNIRAWFGIVAPGATPRLVVETLSVGLEAVLDMAEVHDKLRGMALEPLRGKPDEFAKRLSDKAALWLPVVKAAKIRAE